MAERKIASASKGKPKEAKQAGSSNMLPLVIIAAVIIIAIAVGYLLTAPISGGSESFQNFQGSFYSAPRIGVYVTYINGTTFSYADGCATALIQSMVSSSAHHRNASSIDLMIIANSTSCLAPNGTLGASNGTKVVPISNCLAVSSNEPSVFINYSSTNATSIRAGNLYTQGDALFLSECGVASELG
jgi:hypothetical protein